MGADIYLRSVYELNAAKWRPAFDAAVAERDKYNKQCRRDLAEAAQKKVHEAYDKLFSVGYFRDSYNPSNFLWITGLSWWNDIIPRLNANGELPLKQARWFRNRLAKEVITLDRVKKHIDAREAEHGQSYSHPIDYEGWLKRWQEDQKELIALLDQSLALGERLDCSL